MSKILQQHYLYLLKIDKLRYLILNAIKDHKKNKLVKDFIKKYNIDINKPYQYRYDIDDTSKKMPLTHYFVIRYVQHKRNQIRIFLKSKSKINLNKGIFIAMHDRFTAEKHASKEFFATVKILKYIYSTLDGKLDTRDQDGKNIIHASLINGAPEIAHVLDKTYFETNKQIYKIDKILLDDFAISAAFFNEINGIIERILSKIDINQLYNSTISPLTFSKLGLINQKLPPLMIADNLRILKNLLICGANVNYTLKNLNYNTIIHFYAEIITTDNVKYFLDVIRLFYDYNYNFDAVNVALETPLHIFLQSNCDINADYLKSIQLIFDYSDNPNIVDRYGFTQFIAMLNRGMEIWKSMKPFFMNISYQPFINICGLDINRNTPLINLINIDENLKLDVLYSLTKKYFHQYYTKYVIQTKKISKGGKDDIIIPGINYELQIGGTKNKNCNTIEKILFDQNGQMITSLLYFISKDEKGKRIDTVKTFKDNIAHIKKNKHRDKLKKLLEIINNLPNQYSKCKFDFVTLNDEIANKLFNFISQLYLILSTYVKRPVDHELDVIIDKNNIPKNTYIYSTGNSLDDLFAQVHIYKKHSKLLCDNVIKHYLNDIKNNYFISKYKIKSRHIDVELYKSIYILYDIDNDTLEYSEKLPKIIVKCNKRFISLVVTLTGTIGGHANAIIIDKKTKTLERFEPHGFRINIYDMNKLDKHMNIFAKKFKLNYLSPINLGTSIGPQSQEEQSRIFGDPGGFCIIWSTAYVDIRLSNPNVSPEKLFDKVLIQLRDRNMRIRDYIRKYVKYLYNYREVIFDKVGTTYSDFLSKNITKKQLDQILSLLHKYDRLSS